MKTGVRRTESGGLEVSKGVFQWITALASVLAIAASYGFVVYRAKDRIDHAVQYRELRDTVTTLRRADTAIAGDLAAHIALEDAHHARVDSANAKTSRDVLGLLCERDGYPPSFCSDVMPRRSGPTQAGRARGTP